MISYLSTPSFAHYLQEERNLVSVEEPLTDMPPTKDIRIFYKTTEMMLSPNLFISRNPNFPEEVAVAATFAPSFEPTEATYFEQVSDEIPQQLPVNGSDFHFVFIIDRSGSM